MKKDNLILVVDDNPYMLKAHIHTLASEGFQTLEAASGEECLKLAEEKHPDLILLDVDLPDMDGRDLCNQIKNTPSLSDIFIANITAVARSEEDRVRGLDFGADTYISLPVSPTELLSRVKALLRIKGEQKRISENETFLSTILENIRGGVVVVNAEGDIVLMNEAAVNITGFLSEDSIGSKLTKIIAFDSGEGGSLLKVSITELLFKNKKVIFGCHTQPSLAHKEVRVLECSFSRIMIDDKTVSGGVLTFDDVTEKKQIELEKTKLIMDLQSAMANIKKLSGLLPICSSCKKIRNDSGYWEQIEVFIHDHSDADFTHGICPACAEKLYPDLYKKIKK